MRHFPGMHLHHKARENCIFTFQCATRYPCSPHLWQSVGCPHEQRLAGGEWRLPTGVSGMVAVKGGLPAGGCSDVSGEGRSSGDCSQAVTAASAARVGMVDGKRGLPTAASSRISSKGGCSNCLQKPAAVSAVANFKGSMCPSVSPTRVVYGCPVSTQSPCRGTRRLMGEVLQLTWLPRFAFQHYCNLPGSSPLHRFVQNFLHSPHFLLLSLEPQLQSPPLAL